MPAMDVAALLAAQPAESRTEPPAIPVKTAIFEAKRLFDAARPYRDRFVALPEFRAELFDGLPAIAEFLEGKELAWIAARADLAGKSNTPTRKAAFELKSEAMAAGRYLLRKDAMAQARLDAIAEGDGSVADLVNDLRALAALIEEAPAKFALDPRLPKDAPKVLRDHADKLTSLTDTGAANGAQAERNQLAWLLSDAVNEVRTAARYLFRDDPKVLATMVSAYWGAKNRKKARSQGKSATDSVPE